MSRYILIDGGTTNTRFTLVDDTGAVLAKAASPVGVRSTAINGNNRELCDAVRQGIGKVMAGLRPEDIRACVAYGMITSREGLCEVPHLVAPVSAGDLHAALHTLVLPEVAPFPIAMIRGVRNTAEPVSPDYIDEIDMMRGEETEAIGLWTLLKPEQRCVFVLPGSHNKFVAMDEQGRIAGCMTSISGELLDALTHHTVLTDAVDGRFVSMDTYDRSMLLAGAAACAEAGLGRAAFGARILRTLGHYPAGKAAGYLLGTVLYTDLQALVRFLALRGWERAAIYVAGKEPLQTALCDLLAERQYSPHTVDAALSAKMGVAGALRILLGEPL
ncbi:MAG: 2-dehydro-3-deoxygalactonokinase [Eubacteriales bacterium]|nr:2-dehydro-3-deoxygalactonokinase [Eubacteriales bacterium]